MTSRAEQGAQPVHRNNFDLLRLFAATSVMVLHICDHFGHAVPVLRLILDPFPGVPIFFVISGFLISMSWERVPSWRQYARNRVLRIFPALWLAFGLSIATLLVSGFVIEAPPLKVWLWVVAQLTFGQFVTPSFLEGFGTGILNGSLWTIPVELQFYILLPVLLVWRSLIWVAAVVSVWAAATLLENSIVLPGGLLMPLQATLLPNLYMFAAGVLLARNFDKLRPMLAGQAHWWFLVYVAVTMLSSRFELTVGTNHPSLLPMVFLAFLVISVAYSSPGASWRCLRGNDLSYGIYLYHMVVANFLLEIGFARFWLAIGTTIVLAGMSWRWIERPALSLKKFSLHRTVPSPAKAGS